ncbi:MAG TPA: gliding motility-associated protein GldE [Bacteroidales bacterium]|nr:gliding motility-associated protein GldE [Bacteroidales bacterium]HPS16511.1 gliding motility-associated protein GldE [Bacteroidales bacterium]
MILLILKPFSFEIAIEIIAMVLLLFFSALFSGSEIAYFSLKPIHLNELKNKKTRSGKIILKLLENPKRLLATLLIASNFVNIGIVILSSFITTGLFDFGDSLWIAFIIQVVLVTFLILLVGEITPKIYATHYALQVAAFMSRAMVFCIKLFYPVSSLLIRSTSVIDKRITRKNNITITDLSAALDITTGKDTPDANKKILRGIVKFDIIDVKEVMHSRMDITAVEIKTDYKQLMNIILDSGYSRIPVYKDNLDNITGILHIKDLLPHIEKEADFNWQVLLRPPFFVPESKKIDDLLQEFRQKKNHMAIVIDEYGGTSGMLTMEDIIEEIVGEINDEFDTDEVIFSKLDEKNFVFEGKTLLNDFCRIMNIDTTVFSEKKGESDTLAGLILELEGKIPEKNDKIFYKNFIFTVEAADKRSIKRIKVTLNEKNNSDESNN